MVYATDTRKIKFGDGEHLWRDLPTYEGSAYTLDENNNANFSGVVSSNSKELATKEYVDNSVSSVGSGDMLKSVYDKDNDGIIDDVALLQYYGTTNITISDSSYFTVNSTGETITGLTAEGKTQTELVIPYKINGIEITTLFSGIENDNAEPKSILYGNSRITKVVIPKSVTTLGRGVFYNCFSLTSINIPDSITSIGNYAFMTCESLTSINLPNNVTSIGQSAFDGCTGLTSINIPSSVTSVRNNAFKGCTNLKIYCEQGSYAETYAKANNIPVVYTAINNVASGKVTTITVPTTGWTTSTDTNGITYYTKNITNSILTSTGYPISDVVLPSDIAAARLQSEAYQNVNKITVNDGSVDLYCFDSLPTVSFQIRIQLLYI